ncbi:transglycosylase domain-containing protein [Candidatus Brachybacter algidus]|uniref:transglycosylase domain-containing protein n=1 Tax=Candidatus Brachybacter algidus TaxID=2982024 RepID=UPI001DDADD46|nr:transglycosylase domain-containing protein [Candidatus Brachybacter algidus]MBK6447415.1 transglycosylase domain-containing protein [Candidatus Brachybacter algidus]
MSSGQTPVLANKSADGGSTITPTTGKSCSIRIETSAIWVPLENICTVNIKLKEWITAIKLERSYTKEEIIAMYLNKFNFFIRRIWDRSSFRDLLLAKETKS